MQQLYKAHLVSAAPLLVNNGQLANPKNPFSKELKRLTGKRSKTDADFDEIAKVEWYGSLYLLDGQPCIPAFMLEATLVNAAKKVKKGMQAKAGMYIDQDAILLYEGPQIVSDLWEDERFRFVANCRPQGRSTVIRTRPIFPAWEADIEIHYSDAQLNHADLKEFLTIAGRDIGLGNWRPKYGRFNVA